MAYIFLASLITKLTLTLNDSHDDEKTLFVQRRQSGLKSGGRESPGKNLGSTTFGRRRLGAGRLGAGTVNFGSYHSSF